MCNIYTGIVKYLNKEITTMFMKALQVALVLGFCSFTLAATPNLNLDGLKDDKISKEDNKAVINLLTGNDKLTPQQILDNEIKALQKDIDKWQKMHDDLVALKKEYEDAYNVNEQKIFEYEQEVIRLKAEIEKSTEKITEQSDVIEMKQNLVGSPTLDTDEVVSFDLANGDKIKLIKHIVVKGETLTMIAIKSFNGVEVTKEEIDFRKKTIQNINSQLPKRDNLPADTIVYVPFFK